MKRKMKSMLIMLIVLLCTTAYGEQAPEQNAYQNIYTVSMQYAGENESTKKYLEIAERSAELFPLLEKNAGAFVCETYNYMSIDDEGTPLYTMNGFNYPEEIDPSGQSIRVSKNYFQYNPIKTADGSPLTEQIIYDDMTLNVVVPEKYREMEGQIIEAYRDHFYFEKVKAENDYNAMAGIDKISTIQKESLNIHIIYAEDGQRYFTFRSDCAKLTDNWITDPVVQIYTSNIHCNYAHSFLSQWTFFGSDKESAEQAYQDIEEYIQACGATESIKQVLSVYKMNQ